MTTAVRPLPGCEEEVVAHCVLALLALRNHNPCMTEIQGVPGLVQLEKLERFTEQRIANAAFVTEPLRGSLYQEYIDTSRSFNTSGPTTAGCTTGDVGLPVTKLAAKEGLSLPVHPALSMQDFSIIVREGSALCG